jgi:hypothetical protein
VGFWCFCSSLLIEYQVGILISDTVLKAVDGIFFGACWIEFGFLEGVLCEFYVL